LSHLVSETVVVVTEKWPDRKSKSVVNQLAAKYLLAWSNFSI